MPSTDTTDSSVTSMGFLLLMGNTVSFNDTSDTFTFGNTTNIDLFVFVENLINFDFLFEEFVTEINFFFNRTTVNLDFHNVIFLSSGF